jgi:glycerol uptake facilitator-like aquaporin
MSDTMTAIRRALAAEFIGTFALIFIGAGAAIALGVNHDPPVAFAHGLTILVFVAAFGDISGGHFNPAVTVGLATAGVFPSRRITPYIIAQLAGGIVSAWVLRWAYGGPVNNLGATWSTRSASATAVRSCSNRSARRFWSPRSCTPPCAAPADWRRLRSD